MQDRAVTDMAVFLDDRVGAGKAVHDAAVLQIRAGTDLQPTEVAAQRRSGSDVAARTDDHVADQNGGRMHVRGRIDDRRHAVDGPDLERHRRSP